MADLAAIVRAYNDACSTGSTDDVAAFFTLDAVIYDLNHPPVVGRDAIARFWERIHAKWGGAAWRTELAFSDGVHAVAEWTMFGTSPSGPFTFHGVDMFTFSGSLITEIRQYWRFDPDELHSGLVGHPAHQPE